MKKPILTLAFLALSSCFKISDHMGAPGYEISLGEEDKKYVPSTHIHLNDAYYMKLINDMIDKKALARSNDNNLLRIIKSIAWVESNWLHYYEEGGRYFVILGDDGYAFGIMQIHTLYHDAFPILQENLSYGIDYAISKYNRSLIHNCNSGTNSGSDIIAIARRTYAQYNGGNASMCRNADRRDDNMESAYFNQPWLDYM